MRNIKIGTPVFGIYVKLILHVFRIVRADDNRRLVGFAVFGFRVSISRRELVSVGEPLFELEGKTLIEGFRLAVEKLNSCKTADRSRRRKLLIRNLLRSAALFDRFVLNC